MCNKSITAIYVAASLSIFTCLVGALPVHAEGHPLDAMLLAIEHFDPEHLVGLSHYGDEMNYIDDALVAARKAIPEVANIHIRVGGHSPEFRPMATLRIADPNERNHYDGLDTTFVQKFIDDALVGCRRQRTIKESEGAEGRFTTYTTTIWSYCDYRDECTSSNSIEWLCSNGLRQLIQKKTITNTKTEMQLFFNFSHPVDLVYEASKMENDPQFVAMFGDKHLEPYIPEWFGDGAKIELVASDIYSGYDGIIFRFEYGWGDCPSGCAYSHYWEVTVPNPGGQFRDRRRALDVSSVVEGGDFLPDNIREELQCRGREQN